jgi:hypothetical protein
MVCKDKLSTVLKKTIITQGHEEQNRTESQLTIDDCGEDDSGFTLWQEASLLSCERKRAVSVGASPCSSVLNFKA